MKSVLLMFFLSFVSPVFAFEENFNSFDKARWDISSHKSSHNSEQHSGEFIVPNVDIVNGYLQLEMRQYFDGTKFVSYGAEISSKRNFTYGTFEFRMRSSSTANTPTGVGSRLEGSVTAGFLYADNASTEIDVEFEGSNRKTHLLSWINENTKNEHTSLKLKGSPDENFHVYKFIWYPDKIEYYRDDILIGTHTKKVPEVSAKMFFNHWGTHSKWWGGYATTDVPRYVYIDWFRYTPLEETE